MANPLHSAVFDAHGTPYAIVDAAKVLMGGITLDPASSAAGNDRVGAAHYFDMEQNGLIQRWHGSILLNPPGGVMKATAITEKGPIERDRHLAYNHHIQQTREAIKGLPWYRKTQSIATIWVDRLIHAYFTREIEEAVLVVFNAEMMGAREELYGFPRVHTAYTQKVRIWNAMGKQMVVNPQGRICYLDPQGVPSNSPTHISSLIYLPKRSPQGVWMHDRIDHFRHLFTDFGIYQPAVFPDMQLTACDRCANQRDGVCLINRSECSTWNGHAEQSFFSIDKEKEGKAYALAV